MEADIMEEFIGKEVKVPFDDGGESRIASGTFITYDKDFIKVTGKLGTLIIGRNTIFKISETKNNDTHT